MNHYQKIHTFSILGAVMALALMPIIVDSAYAESQEDVAAKIQEIEKRLNTIQEKSENFKDSDIGKQAFQFRITGEMISELKDPSVQSIIKSDSALKGKVNDLVSKYGSTLNEYSKKVTQFERTSDVSLDKKNAIKQLKKNQMDYEQKITKVEQEQKTKEFVKSELARIKAYETFQKLHQDVYVANDKDRGINSDDTLLIALTEVVEKEDFALVSAGMDKMINQYRDAEVRAQLQEYKAVVMDAMEELEEVDDQNTDVLALTSGDVEISEDGEGFGIENEIFNAEIIKNQLKQKIKSAVTSTKVLADKIYEEQKSQYAAAKKIADKLSDDKPTTSTIIVDDPPADDPPADDPPADDPPADDPPADLDKKTKKALEKEAKKAEKQEKKLQKALEKAEKKLQKALEKAEKKLQKALEKAEKKAEKKEEKQEKKLQKALEKAEKKLQKALEKAEKKADKKDKDDDSDD